MKKALKVTLSIISGIIIFLIMLPVVVSMVLQINVVQKFVVDFASSTLSEIAGTNISIKKVALDFFTSARFEDVLMEDYRGDTMIYAKKIKVDINGINFISGKITLGATTLEDAQINLFKDSTRIMNIGQVFKHFKRRLPNPNPPTFQLTAQELNLVNTKFTLRDYIAPEVQYGINFKDMECQNINLAARNISVYNHNIWLEIEKLSFSEKSGFNLEEFSSRRCGVDSSGMYYADAQILSNNTKIELDSVNFLTANQTWWDWNDFENKMIISARINESSISTPTLSYFVRYQMPRSNILKLKSARVRGAVSDLQGEFNQLDFQGNRVWAKFHIEGLPDGVNALYDLNIEKLEGNANTINKAVDKITKSSLPSNIYNIIDNLGECTLSAQFSGKLNNISSSLTLNSQNSGEVLSNCNLIINAQKSSILQGDISTTDFNLGRTLNVSKIRNTSFFSDFNIIIPQESPIIVDANMDVAQFYYGAYNFENININGELESRQFDGLISCADTNFCIDISGFLDFSKSTPEYELDVDLHHANLAKIGVNKRDSISLLSAEFIALGSGANIDEFNGVGSIDKILYINHLDTINTGAINIASVALEQYKELEIESNFADVTFRGRNSFNEIGRYLAQSITRFLPSLPEVGEIVTQEDISELSKASSENDLKNQQADFPFSEGYYQLKIDIKKANNVAGIFYPSLKIASGSTLNFFFNPYLDQITFKTQSEYISSTDFFIENLSIDSRNISDSLTLYSTVSLLAIGNMTFDNVSVLGGIRNNVVSLGGQFKQADGRNSALINTTTSFNRLSNGMAQMDVRIHPSPLMWDSTRFNLANANLLFDTTGVSIHNFSIYNDKQELTIHGKLGDYISDTIGLTLSNADITPASMLVENLGYDISGSATGGITAVATLGDIQMTAAIDFKDVVFGGYELDDSQLRCVNDKKNGQINLFLGVDSLNVPATGFYNYISNSFGADFKYDSLPLVLLDPMLKGVLVQSNGTAKTNLELRGRNREVLLNGDIVISDYSTMLDYTKVRYKIPKAVVKVENSSFHLDPTLLDDFNGGTGAISAQLKTESFRDMTYNIRATFTDLLAMNTTFADNSSFYGKAYGTGVVTVEGNQKNTNIEINGQSAKNSSIIMPFSGASTAKRMDFIRYVDADRIIIKRNDLSTRLNDFRMERERYISQNKSKNELDIKLNIEVLPNTIAQLELDAKVGDIIKGRGEGRLDIHINPDLDIFTINGPIQITEGNYLFTLQTIINKRFTINPGGQLFWVGDPTNPDVDITALYRIKTSLTPLLGTTLSSGSSNTNIDCGIELTGKLLSPDIEFSISAPSSDIETQNYIQNSINTQEALSMQFLSLMLANTFMSDMGTAAIGTMGSSVAGVTGLEFLSNQLSNLISNDNLNIRFGYRPQNTTSSDEFYAGVGADIISDVLSIEVDGNYNALNNSASDNENPFSVDAYITWNINTSGSLKLKGFTRTIDRFDETQGLQESGLGVYFSQEFNNFKDLQIRVKDAFKRDSTKIKAAELRKAERIAKRDKRRDGEHSDGLEQEEGVIDGGEAESDDNQQSNVEGVLKREDNQSDEEL